MKFAERIENAKDRIEYVFGFDIRTLQDWHIAARELQILADETLDAAEADYLDQLAQIARYVAKQRGATGKAPRRR